ncbi:MAG TPA: 2-oxoacid:acceptor oxidoreductase family protein [Bdellovibrionota bacterium]|nr:2-oxoacid:acceptor oxidoreductase family protein [Bdellovibrionota bacterium]
MQIEVTFAGFGGQGVLAIGQILALAGMEDGKHVIWLPSYGPEMRGGTAYCSVVIADHPIGSPIISQPSCVAVMNRPSFDKFVPHIKPNGLLIVNSSLIDIRSDRADIDQVYIPANDLAVKAGNAKAANMPILGAFAARNGAIEPKLIREAVEHKLGGKKDLLAINLQLFDQGFEAAAHASARAAVS